MDSAAFPVQWRVCVWRSSVPREAMRDSLPYCSNLSQWVEAPSRQKSSERIPYLSRWECCLSPEAEGLHKATVCYVACGRVSQKHKCQRQTCSLRCPRTSEIQACPAQRLQTDFCISSAQESDTIARGALKSYTFTQARFDHFDSLFSATSSSTPGKPIDTYGPILGQTFSSSHMSVAYKPTNYRKVLITL